MNQIKVCIAATIRRFDTDADLFIAYHLKMGVDKIYLFVSNPHENNRPLPITEKVDITLTDDQLKEVWKGIPDYNIVAPYIATETMARQYLNLSVALDKARDDQMDWIAHLDGDELLYCETGTIRDFLEATPDHVGQMVLANHEVMPSEFEMEVPFNEMLPFKKSRIFLSRKADMKAHHYFSMKKRFFFVAYINGKAICRLGPDTKACTIGPHRFLPPAKHPSTWLAPQEFSVLHYAETSFKRFQSKYQDLGDFPNTWFGNAEVTPFRIISRNLMKEHGEEALKKFYNEQVVYDDPEEIRQLELDGIVKWANPFATVGLQLP